MAFPPARAALVPLEKAEAKALNLDKINTKARNSILYQGNSFVIYYDTNSWELTRLGKINGLSAAELRDILGTGDVSVTLSLSKR